MGYEPKMSELCRCRVLFLLAMMLPFGFGANLQQPRSVSSTDGRLFTTIVLRVGEIVLEDGTRIVKAPLFNGTIPAPTLRVHPGDSLHITFRNELPDLVDAVHVNNVLSSPHESNLHLHGLFVSGELPSDDAKLVIRPGESYDYEVKLPQQHLPGTHWYHPHRHGSTAFQLSCGAAGVVLVEDPPNFLPKDIASATEVVLLLEEIIWDETSQFARESKADDQLFQIDTVVRNRVTLVNGQLQPTLDIDTTEWVRFRIVNAGWQGESMDLTISSCDMQLIAKDGIYIMDVPRSISAAHIFLGGRADVLVRCPSAGTYTMMNRGRNAVLDLRVTALSSVVETPTISAWTPPYPDYLQDLRSTQSTDGCACVTKVGTRSGNNREDDSINGLRFEDGTILHSSYIGAVVERTLLAERHPYHQHTYPFQVIDVLQQSRASDPNYIREGDWYDSWEGKAVVRYHPQEFVTKVMVHCHILEHEDKGMMAMEVVNDSGSCTCDGFRTNDREANNNSGSGAADLTRKWFGWSPHAWLLASLCVWLYSDDSLRGVV